MAGAAELGDPLVPLKLANVSTQQPCISADSLQIPGLQINANG